MFAALSFSRQDTCWAESQRSNSIGSASQLAIPRDEFVGASGKPFFLYRTRASGSRVLSTSASKGREDDGTPVEPGDGEEEGSGAAGCGGRPMTFLGR